MPPESLTALQQAVLEAVKVHYRTHHLPVRIMEIREMFLDYSRPGIAYTLKTLVFKGYLRHRRGLYVPIEDAQPVSVP